MIRAVSDSVAVERVEGTGQLFDRSKMKRQSHISHAVEALKCCSGTVQLDCQIDLDIFSAKLHDASTKK